MDESEKMKVKAKASKRSSYIFKYAKYIHTFSYKYSQAVLTWHVGEGQREDVGLHKHAGYCEKSKKERKRYKARL